MRISAPQNSYLCNGFEFSKTFKHDFAQSTLLSKSKVSDRFMDLLLRTVKLPSPQCSSQTQFHPFSRKSPKFAFGITKLGSTQVFAASCLKVLPNSKPLPRKVEFWPPAMRISAPQNSYLCNGFEFSKTFKHDFAQSTPPCVCKVSDRFVDPLLRTVQLLSPQCSHQNPF